MSDHGGDVVYVCTEFHSNNMLQLACYNDTKKHCQRLFVVVYKYVCC